MQDLVAVDLMEYVPKTWRDKKQLKVSSARAQIDACSRAPG